MKGPNYKAKIYRRGSSWFGHAVFVDEVGVSDTISHCAFSRRGLIWGLRRRLKRKFREDRSMQEEELITISLPGDRK